MTEDIYEDSIYGQVLPMEWNKDKVSALVLMVDGEEEFIVEHDDNGESLIDHIDRWVTAEGIITETDEEIRIKVRNYTLEDDMDFDTDDDW